jgi:phosphate starvation-inducible protein PhoH
MSEPESKPKRAIRPKQLPPSRQELMSRGETASALLQSPVFNLAVRGTIENLQDEILQSQPGDTAGREALYFRMRGLNDVLAELAGYVHIAQSMSDREKEAEELADLAGEAYLRG